MRKAPSEVEVVKVDIARPNLLKGGYEVKPLGNKYISTRHSTAGMSKQTFNLTMSTGMVEVVVCIQVLLLQARKTGALRTYVSHGPAFQ